VKREEEALDELFATPLDRFVKRRAELAAEAKKNGRAEEAAALKAIPKPTVSVWAVNQLYRDHAEEFRVLLDAGEALRHAHAAALAGHGIEAFRRATDEQRSALAGLRDAATELLESGGHAASSTTLERVMTTLRALSIRGSFDPDAPGRLTRDLDPPGFEAAAGTALPPRQEAKAPKERAAAPHPKTHARAPSEAVPARDHARESKKAEREAKRQKARDLAREAARVEREKKAAAKAEERRERERAALERTLERAETRAKQADAELRDAAREVERLERLLAKAVERKETVEAARDAARAECEDATARLREIDSLTGDSPARAIRQRATGMDGWLARRFARS
jgi:DNA repair exonuclease SbcCD ATPase subunit